MAYLNTAGPHSCMEIQEGLGFGNKMRLLLFILRVLSLEKCQQITILSGTSQKKVQGTRLDLIN